MTRRYLTLQLAAALFCALLPGSPAAQQQSDAELLAQLKKDVPETISRFKQNKFEFTANVSAAIIKAGAGKAADYRDGVAVFTQPTGGEMAEIALGTQKFSFKPEPAAAKK